MPLRLVVLVSAWLASLAASAQAPMDLRLAARIFQEARWASEDDAGALWGKPLYGPMLFANPATREVVANQADSEGHLQARDGVWVGKLPPEVGIANTAFSWAGVRWTMVMWPLIGAPANRMDLVMHECFHRIQKDLGLPAPDQPQANAHLDTRLGRVWLRLEWLALGEALLAREDAQERAAIEDALRFRAWRRKLFPEAAPQEDRMEVHEGLAEYTGVRRMGLGPLSRHNYLSGRLRTAIATRPSLPMSFAYESGPAYGLLLDAANQPWQSEVTPSGSLSALLAKRHNLVLLDPREDDVMARAKRYGGDTVFQEEAQRERVRAEREAAYRRTLVQGPVLELPLRESNYTFNPNEVFQLGADGVVFPHSYLVDAWGVLEVEQGLRLNAPRDRAFIIAPLDPGKAAGLGWTLTLNPGWKLSPGARKGDYILLKEP